MFCFSREKKKVRERQSASDSDNDSDSDDDDAVKAKAEKAATERVRKAAKKHVPDQADRACSEFAKQCQKQRTAKDINEMTEKFISTLEAQGKKQKKPSAQTLAESTGSENDSDDNDGDGDDDDAVKAKAEKAATERVRKAAQKHVPDPAERGGSELPKL